MAPSYRSTTSVMAPRYTFNSSTVRSGSSRAASWLKPAMSLMRTETSRFSLAWTASGFERTAWAILSERYRVIVARTRSDSRSRSTAARAWPSVTSRSDMSIGFVRKSKAPRFIAVRMFSMSP